MAKPVLFTLYAEENKILQKIESRIPKVVFAIHGDSHKREKIKGPSGMTRGFVCAMHAGKVLRAKQPGSRLVVQSSLVQDWSRKAAWFKTLITQSSLVQDWLRKATWFKTGRAKQPGSRLVAQSSLVQDWPRKAAWLKPSRAKQPG